MRTIRRITLKLNKAKWQALNELAKRYASEKDRCKHADYADRVAAINLKARKDDPEIFLFTPKERVKAILLARFTARLETDLGTVSGRTPDTRNGQSESETAQAILC